MKGKKTSSYMVVVTLVALALPGTASASPELGETSGGVFTRLATGTKIVGTAFGEELMTNSSGQILTRCSAAKLIGELTKNNGTEIEGIVTSASFTGTGSESRCTATFGNSTVTPTVTEGGVAHGLPWCLRATNAMNADEFQVRGGKCSEASRDIRFILDVFGGTECEYQRTTPIPGIFSTDTGGWEPAPAISKQKFSRIRGSSLVCPSEGFLDMAFTPETEGGIPLYIK